jgi:hypothetical protein
MKQAIRTAFLGTNGGRQFVTHGFRSREGTSHNPTLKLAALGGSDHDRPTDDPAVRQCEYQENTPVRGSETFLVNDKEEAKKERKT